MNTTPVLLLDFDGVLNFDNSIKTQKKTEDTPHYLQRKYLYADGFGYPVNYSGEVVYRLNSLKRKAPYEWLWLSTWRRHTDMFLEELGTYSDGYLNFTDADGQGYPGYDVRESYGAKLAHVLRINDEECRPFVWVDDEATEFFDVNLLRFPDTPHLVVKPNPSTGLTRTELDSIEEFMLSNSASVSS